MGERGVVMFLFLILVSGACFVDAAEAEVVMVDDIGSFSGAILRIKSTADGEPGDKIYASEYLTQVGIIKFNIETSLSEVFLDITLTKSGMVVDTIAEGPFVVDGSEILIDRREGAEEVAAVQEVEVVVEEDESVEVVEDEVIESEVIEADVSDNDVQVKKSLRDMGDDTFFLYLIGGVLTFIVFMVMWFKFGTFRDRLTRLNYFSEEGELARIEAQIKRKDELIDRIKKNKARKEKIKLATKKLERENAKLEKLIRKGLKKKSKK